jgi:hypothetical protein
MKAFQAGGRQAAADGTGWVLKLSPLLFTIDEQGPALTSFVNGTPTIFSILKPAPTGPTRL